MSAETAYRGHAKRLPFGGTVDNMEIFYIKP